MSWLVERYPGVHFSVENTAIGATGSDLAVLRAKRALLDRRYDLVFVDCGERLQQARERLSRKLLEDGTYMVWDQPKFG